MEQLGYTEGGRHISTLNKCPICDNAKRQDRKTCSHSCAAKYRHKFGNLGNNLSKAREKLKNIRDNLTETQKKDIAFKSKITKLKKYGNPNYNNPEKMRQTNLKKYGVEHNWSSLDGKLNGRNTRKLKYGDEVASKNYYVKEKMKATIANQTPEQKEITKQRYTQTSLLKFGVTNPTKSKAIRAKMEKTYKSKTGYLTPFHNMGWQKQHHENLKLKGHYESSAWIGSSESKTENEIKQYLLDIGYVFKKTRKVIKPLEIDLYNEKLKIGIEYNGDYWHSDEMIMKTRGMSAQEFHDLKTMRCMEMGIRLLHISENEYISNKDKTMDKIIKFIETSSNFQKK